MSCTKDDNEPDYLKTVHLNIDADTTEEEREEIMKWFKENFKHQ